MPEQIENRMVVDSEWQPPTQTVKMCDSCESAVHEGDVYYDIGGDCICSECIKEYINMNFRRFA